MSYIHFFNQYNTELFVNNCLEVVIEFFHHELIKKFLISILINSYIPVIGNNYSHRFRFKFTLRCYCASFNFIKFGASILYFLHNCTFGNL
jgi:hypothetical protein